MAPIADPPNPNDAQSTTEAITLYEASTQYRYWRFSAAQLAERRRAMSAAAINAIRGVHDADEPGSSSKIDFLSPDDELVLIKLYLDKIPQLCGHFRFPEEVEATAMSYLRRFYLKNTVMDWHPKNIMLTALYLATKTTNHPLAIDNYVANIPRTSASDVLDLEFLVAQSLGFQFAVWSSSRALWGIYLDYQSMKSFRREEASSAYMLAQSHVKSSRLTDAELIYSPSQIAAACMHMAGPIMLEEWLAEKGELAVLPVLKEIEALVESEGKVPNVEVVREIDRRLRICKNPEKVEGTKAYLRKRQELEEAEDLKRTKKAARIRAAADQDPFADDSVNGVTNGEEDVNMNGSGDGFDDDD